jgi:hypothetical protein
LSVSGRAAGSASRSRFCYHHRMSSEWLAVARGLKCLSISIKASVATVIVTLIAMIPLCMALCGGRILAGMLLLPAIVSAFVALAFSRIARLFLLKVPRHITDARFSVTASLVLELIGQTGLGASIAVRVFHIGIPDELEIPWFAASLIAGFIGWLYFHRSLHKIAIHTISIDSDERLSLTRGLVFMAGMPFALGCLIGYIARDPMILLISAVFFVIAMIFFVIAIFQYSKAVRSLRFSALREAVRYERFGENRG